MCSEGERKNGEISRQPQGREGLVKITFLEIKATESRIIQVLATAARFVRSLGLLKKQDVEKGDRGESREEDVSLAAPAARAAAHAPRNNPRLAARR